MMRPVMSARCLVALSLLCVVCVCYVGGVDGAVRVPISVRAAGTRVLAKLFGLSRVAADDPNNGGGADCAACTIVLGLLAEKADLEHRSIEFVSCRARHKSARGVALLVARHAALDEGLCFCLVWYGTDLLVVVFSNTDHGRILL